MVWLPTTNFTHDEVAAIIRGSMTQKSWPLDPQPRPQEGQVEDWHEKNTDISARGLPGDRLFIMYTDIQLEVTGVRIRQLHDIGKQGRHDEFMKEGWPWGYEVGDVECSPFELFSLYWDSRYRDHPDFCWDANPWVKVQEFKRVYRKGDSRAAG